jgi:hypothetical protein
MMCFAIHWLFIFRCVRCNSEYQVHVMKCVRYVGWATSSRATMKIHLYVKKKKKRVVTHAHLYCSIVFNISFSLSEFEMIIVFKKIIVQTVSDLDDELHVWWWDFWIAGAYDEDSERLDMKIEKIRDTWWNNVGPLQLEGIWWSGK